MELAPYLNFNGDCDAAFTFYAQCLGGRIVRRQTFGESPMRDQVPADWQDKLIHVDLEFGRSTLMGSDAMPPHYSTPQGISLSIQTTTAEEAERLFNALSEGGTVMMPFQKTYWSPGFGMLKDRFGISWMVNVQQAA